MTVRVHCEENGQTGSLDHRTARRRPPLAAAVGSRPHRPGTRPGRQGAKTIDTGTPARLYALVAGAGLTLLGIGGFFYGSSFDTGTRAIRAQLGEVLGIFAVNGWTDVLHLATGLIALALAMRAARSLALGLGLAYILLAIWGLLAIDRGVGEILGVFAVNGATCVLWLVVGLAGTAAGAATGELPAMPRRTPRGRPRLRRPTRARKPAEEEPASRPAPAPLDQEAEREARRRERRARRSGGTTETDAL